MVQCPPKQERAEGGPLRQAVHSSIDEAIHIDVVTNSQAELPFNLSVQLIRQYDLRSESGACPVLQEGDWFSNEVDANGIRSFKWQ